MKFFQSKGVRNLEFRSVLTQMSGKHVKIVVTKTCYHLLSLIKTLYIHVKDIYSSLEYDSE